MLLICLIIMSLLGLVSFTPLLLGKAKKDTLFFAFMGVGLVIWSFSDFMTYDQTNLPDEYLFWNRLAYFGAVFIITFLTLFVTHYPKPSFRWNFLSWILFGIIPLSFCVMSFTPLIVKSMSSPTEFEVGIGNTFYGIFFVTYFLYTLFHLVRGIQKNSEGKAGAYKLILFGILFSVTGGFITNFFMPLFDMTPSSYVGPILTLVMIMSLAYALMKYQMLDVRFIVSKAVAWVLTAACGVVGFVFVTYFYLWFVGTRIEYLYEIITIVYFLAFITPFNLLRIRLQSTAEKFFIRGKYDYKKLLIRFADELSSKGTISEIKQLLLTYFQNDIEIWPIRLFVPHEFDSRKDIARRLIERQADSETDAVLSIQEQDQLYAYLEGQVGLIILEKVAHSVFEQANASAALLCRDSQDQLIGLLTLGSKMSQDSLTDDDKDLLVSISKLLESALLKVKQARVSAEMEVAQLIQSEILPKTPVLPHLEISCFMRPADEVGGDYYDVFTSGERSWVVVGDVTGHGIAAGLVMFMVQSIMNAFLTVDKALSPSTLLCLANNLLTKSLERLHDPRPMTIVAISTVNGKQFQVCGSHDNIYVFRGQNRCVEVISVQNFPMGIGLMEMDQGMFSETFFELHKDDVLFIGTDGITEAPQDGDMSKGQFGEERLIALLTQYGHLPITEIQEKLLHTLHQFTKNTYFDDVTFVIAKTKS